MLFDRTEAPLRTLSPLRLATAGMLTLAAAIGIGRFAFTPVLPMMQRDLGLSLQAAGWLASANYAGYFVGALSAVWLRGGAAYDRPWRAHRDGCVDGGMGLTSTSTRGSACARWPVSPAPGRWCSRRRGCCGRWRRAATAAWVESCSAASASAPRWRVRFASRSWGWGGQPIRRGLLWACWRCWSLSSSGRCIATRRNRQRRPQGVLRRRLRRCARERTSG